MQSDISQLKEFLKDISDEIDKLGVDKSIEFLEDCLASNNLNYILKSAIIGIIRNLLNGNLFHMAATRSAGYMPEISFIGFPVGLTSFDRSAVLGRNGFIFLTGGSNDVISQYNSIADDCKDSADKWIALFEKRIVEAQKRNIAIIQTIIPEKITVLPEYFPSALTTPTQLLHHVEQKLKSSFAKQNYLSGRDILCNSISREDFYKKTDSHLTPNGSFLIFKNLIKHLFSIQIPEYRFTRPTSGIGDLVHRMFGVYLAEDYYEVENFSLPFFVGKTEKTFDSCRDNTSYTGRKQIWENNYAPIKKKIVVFGNSYYSTVENGQSNLSWWFANWFKDFHFIWSNEIDWAYIDEVQPQMIIWQGTERFLPIVPLQ